MEKKEKLRIKLVFACFLIAFLLVVGKAIKVQIIDGEKLIAQSKNQFFRESTVFPRRGMIYDRNGHPLALNIQTYSIFTIPRNLNSDMSELNQLSSIIPELNIERIKERVRSRDRFTWIARKIALSREQVESIESLTGIHIEAVPKRLYPNGELAAQVLGFVGVDNVGLSGIEHRFDEQLRGRPSIFRYVIDNKGRPIKFESADVQSDAENIYLSIDKDIQFIAEKFIKEAVEYHDAEVGGIGVMHAYTGEVLAIANYPSFDPNNPHINPRGIHRLPFVSDPFEPGSTFKSFTVASALENRIARRDTNYYCERGRLRIGRHIITEAESNRSYEWLSVAEILSFSSNIGTTKIAFDLTYPVLDETIRDFGFGNRTGLELPGESRGILLNQKNVSPLSLSNISFGQGIATTGIQMLAAYAPFANGGYYVEPTIFKRESKETISKRRVLSEQVADEVRNILVDAVEKGTGSNAKVPYFTIAGKTSTAQRVSPSGGYEGYTPGFIGFPVGVNDPFIIYVYIEDPKGETVYGNRVAAPVFQKVAQHILYNTQEFKNINFSDINEINHRRDYATDVVRVRRSAHRDLGVGKAPNFIGLDRISSSNLAMTHNLDTEHVGIGVVSSQKPKPGESISKDTTILLRYSPPHYE